MGKVRAVGLLGVSIIVLLATGWLSSTPAGTGIAGELQAGIQQFLLASDTCGAASYEIGTLPYSTSATTSGMADDYDFEETTPTCDKGEGIAYGGTGTGPDVVFKIATDKNCTLNANMVPTTGVDLALYVLYPDCSDVVDGNCIGVDDEGGSGAARAEDVAIEADGGKLYYIIVDGYDDGSTVYAGAFDLTISETTSEGCKLVDPASSLGGKVWEDLNGDGFKDAGEPGIGSVTVKLYLDSDSTYVGTTSTNASGLYTFTGVLPDYYYLEFLLPSDSGYYLTKDMCPDGPCDSTPDPNTGKTEEIDVGPVENQRGWDAGMYRLVGLGGRVWEDLNGNGLQEAGEPGISLKRVELKDCQDDDFGNVDTAGDGSYSFGSEAPGSYVLEFEKSEDWCVSDRDQGDDDKTDSDVYEAYPELASTACFTIPSGTRQDHWDAGMYEKLDLEGWVWHDEDRDGIQDQGELGVEDILVGFWDDGTCSEGAGFPTSTDLNGDYSLPQQCMSPYCLEVGDIPAGWFISPPDQGDNDALDSDADPITAKITNRNLTADARYEDVGLYEGLSLGGRVWHDKDWDGIQDSGESGVANIAVDWYRNSACSGAASGSATTGSDGVYAFPKVSVGATCLQFRNLPAGWVISPQDKGDDAQDSDADPAAGQIMSITVTADDSTQDVGMYEGLLLGGRVWSDENQDGIQDAGEPGVAKITIDRYPNAVCSGAPAGSATTNATGIYAFPPLQAGSACLHVRDIPVGWFISPKDNGNDDTLDSDAEPATGHIRSITLEANHLDEDVGLYERAGMVYLPLVVRAKP